MWNLINVIDEAETAHNGKIKVVKTFEGTRIIVGGLSQSGWLVKKVWQAALKKVKKVRPAVESVLILGLGGGSVAELVQEYWPESKKVGLDIDAQMIEFGKDYLKLKSVTNLKTVVADAQSWIEKSKEKFDLVLVDMYKGANIPQSFTTEKFFRSIKNLLNPEGLAAFNHLCSSIEKVEADKFGQRLSKVFPAVTSVTPEANIIYICFS